MKQNHSQTKTNNVGNSLTKKKHQLMKPHHPLTDATMHTTDERKPCIHYQENLPRRHDIFLWVARGVGRERPMREAVHRTHSHSAERPPQHKHSPPEAQELGKGGGAPSQAAATFPPFVFPQ